MINERQEFEAYTGAVSYTAINKHDTTYLGRFTFDTIIKGEGLARVLTILARGFYWDSGCDIDYTRRALCAWCSIPDKKNAKPKEEWQFRTDFCELHEEFPSFVDADGRGWFYRHAHAIAGFIENNPGKVYATAKKQAEIIRTKWDKWWRDRVVKMQMPLFADRTKGGFILVFDGVIADAIEQGALRDKDITLPPSLFEAIDKETPNIRADILYTLIAYYIANRQPDTDWVVLPVSNFDAYFGTTSFSRKILNTLPETVLVRDRSTCGVSRYKVAEKVLSLMEDV